MQGARKSASSGRRWLITGATGFIGRELIRGLLGDPRYNQDQILALVRPGERADASARLAYGLTGLGLDDQYHRIAVIPGNVAERRFGVCDADWQRLCRVTHIVHLAANTSFSASIDEARHTNVLGVRNVIDLARACLERGALVQWSHVSTAYVAGSRTDQVRPGEMDNGCAFRNCYEQSKHEAEQLLRPLMDDYPLTIFRPSIVVGNSRDGAAGNFNTVYWAIRSYLGGQMRLFANPDTPLDLVPVDYVAGAILEISRCRNADGRTVHLAGGSRTTIPLLTFANGVCEYLDSPMPEVINPKKLRRLRGFIALAKFSKRHKRFIEQAESYLPYFSQNPTFVVDETEELLRESGIEVPHPLSYLDKILDYCLAQPWGKRSTVIGKACRQRFLANA